MPKINKKQQAVSEILSHAMGKIIFGKNSEVDDAILEAVLLYKTVYSLRYFDAKYFQLSVPMHDVKKSNYYFALKSGNVPGARFDPFGPPNPARPGAGTGHWAVPDPDHEQPPPGFDDMFM